MWFRKIMPFEMRKEVETDTQHDDEDDDDWNIKLKIWFFCCLHIFSNYYPDLIFNFYCQIGLLNNFWMHK